MNTKSGTARSALIVLSSFALAALAGCGAPADSEASPSGEHVNETAQAASTPATCLASQLSVTVTTNGKTFAPGSKLIATATAKNTSRQACTLDVGPNSPWLTVFDAAGDVAWNQCDVDDQPGACLLFVLGHSLGAGQSYTKTFTWDEETSRLTGTVERVPAGTYEVRTGFYEISKQPEVAIQITD
ncbi:MAG TPA: hypothetical protein VGI39_15330 [Polyangiaceae bacterium]|jgi:hypothetical protein